MIKIKTKAGSIDLPKLTLALSEMTDDVEACTDTRERYEKQLTFLQEVIPPEPLAKILDGETLEEIDLVELSVTYAAAVNAYAAPIIEEQTKAVNDGIKAVQPALNAMRQVQAAQSRQGFESVR